MTSASEPASVELPAQTKFTSDFDTKPPQGQRTAQRDYAAGERIFSEAPVCVTPMYPMEIMNAGAAQEGDGPQRSDNIRSSAMHLMHLLHKCGGWEGVVNELMGEENAAWWYDRVVRDENLGLDNEYVRAGYQIGHILRILEGKDKVCQKICADFMVDRELLTDGDLLWNVASIRAMDHTLLAGFRTR
jgi:hypothetical protein